MFYRAWPRRLGEALRPFGTALLDLLYPPLCLGCDRAVPDATAPLCHRCLKNVERADPASLDQRLQRLPVRAPLASAHSLWIFDRDGRLQRVQHALKYGNRPRYGVLLGRLMGETLDLPPVDAVVPVPLHRTRFLERGYNQSGALGRGLADVLGAPLLDHALERTRATRSQTHLDRSARWDNVHDAFGVEDDATLQPRDLLLVDDVLTTGATAAAAAQALLDGGAASVHLATLALARG